MVQDTVPTEARQLMPKELEAKLKDIARQLRQIQRQGFIPGKTADIAIVEQTLRTEQKEVEDELQPLSLLEDDRR